MHSITPAAIFILLALALPASAQTTSAQSASSQTASAQTVSAQNSSTSSTSSYVSSNTTITLTLATTSTSTSALTNSSTTVSTSTLLPTATATLTPSTPCNGFTEFCNRSYSNITFVGAHNSMFDEFGNIASNQEYDVFAQLNDGIRMLQGQTHMDNGGLSFCHTYCLLEDAGPIENYFFDVTQWLDGNPSEVVTILIANGDYSPVTDFVAPINNSGLLKYAYVPPKNPMRLGDWPTLGELIGNNTRAIIFMDYEANEPEVPYVLNEFTQMFETPFDPTDRNFPCNVDRPGGLSNADAENWLYLTNHNLNVNVTIDIITEDLTVLLPDLALLPQTNGRTGYGSLGAGADTCTATWGRPPNFMLVDYYNWGAPNGSVFEVAARLNGVNYTTNCCGKDTNVSSLISAAPSVPPQGDGRTWIIVATLALAVALAL